MKFTHKPNQIIKAGIKKINTCFNDHFLYSFSIFSTSLSADGDLVPRVGASMVGSGETSSGVGSMTVSSASSAASGSSGSGCAAFSGSGGSSSFAQRFLMMS